MPLIEEVLKYDTVSIVGVEKNTGKTECLNYLLGCLAHTGRRVAVTSTGVDGERTDRVTLTAKPEITLGEGMLFATCEKYYRQRQLTAEVVDVSREGTALGRVVTARALGPGTALLSGPPTTASLRAWIGEAHSSHGAGLCIVDGALSRMSSASPAVCRAMILATGAAYSENIATLVRHTRFVCDLIGLPVASSAAALSDIGQGVWALDERGGLHDLGIASAFATGGSEEDIFRFGTRFFVPGVLNNRFLEMVMRNAKTTPRVTVSDFTRIFVTPELFCEYTKRGGRIDVVQKPALIAVCVNPFSPRGRSLHPEALEEQMGRALDVPVYNIRKEAGRCN